MIFFAVSFNAFQLFHHFGVKNKKIASHLIHVIKYAYQK